MRLYWRETRRGMELLVQTDDGEEFSVGGVRETKRGVEALAKTTGYDPGRAIKGLNSLDEGRAFVEQFEPWLEFFPGEELAVEDKVLPREET